MKLLNKYYYPPVNFWSVWFAETVIRNLQNNADINKDESFLDIGCGLGNLCFSLREYSPSEVYGFDISNDTINLLKEFSDKIKFQRFNICEDNISGYENKFNHIFSCDVYEHVEDPQLMLNNIYKMLKENGNLSITFPNFNDHGHNQLENIEQIESQLQKAGFNKFKISVIKDRVLIYKLYTQIYVILQDISDIFFKIKRNKNRMPESDEFHEMYAYKKISKIKKYKSLIIFINLIYRILTKIGRISSIYKTENNNNNLENKRILIYAKKSKD